MAEALAPRSVVTPWPSRTVRSGSAALSSGLAVAKTATRMPARPAVFAKLVMSLLRLTGDSQLCVGGDLGLPARVSNVIYVTFYDILGHTHAAYRFHRLAG